MTFLKKDSLPCLCDSEAFVPLSFTLNILRHVTSVMCQWALVRTRQPYIDPVTLSSEFY